MDNQITNKPIFIPYKGDTTNVTQKTSQPQANVTEKEKPIDLGHEKLLSCMYFIFDAFERCSIEFFLVRDTATKAKTEYMLEGDHIDIGVRSLEWQNDSKDLLFPYFDQEHVTKIEEEADHMTFKWNDVAFTIHFYADNPCVTALIPIVYEHEHWKIPNRFDIFEKEYDK